MRLIQCLRGPTSPSGMVFSAEPSGPPNSRKHLFRGVERNTADQKDVLLHAGAPMQGATVAGSYAAIPVRLLGRAGGVSLGLRRIPAHHLRLLCDRFGSNGPTQNLAQFIAGQSREKVEIGPVKCAGE